MAPFGISVLAPPLDDDTAIVTCPFSLIIIKHTASQALKSLLGPNAHALDTWPARQLICSYVMTWCCAMFRTSNLSPPQ